MALVNTPGQSGVLPYTIEPFNDAQRSALSSMMSGQPSQYETGYGDMFMRAMGGFNPQEFMQRQGRLYDTAEGLLGSATPMTGQQFGERISTFMNPYTQQVLDPTISRMRQAADVARGRLAAGRTGTRSFGDTAMGTENALIESELGRNIGEVAGNLNYQGYNTALGQVNAEANRALQGSQIAGGLGTQVGQSGMNWMDALGGFAGMGQDFANQRTDRQLSAGNQVQGFNQRIADILGGLIEKQTNAPATQLSELGAFLNMFPGTQNAYAEAEPNMFDRLGGAGMLFGGAMAGGGGGQYLGLGAGTPYAAKQGTVNTGAFPGGIAPWAGAY